MGLTPIEWTDRSWSPLRVRVKADAAAIAEKKGYTSLVQIATKMAGHVGPHCERVSHGCDHCYSDTNHGRCLPSNGTGLPFDRRARDLVDSFVDEKILLQPLKWRKPQRIFVENQSDLFGEWNTDEMIDRVFAVAGMCDGVTPWERFGKKPAGAHTLQVLTKRPERMRDYVLSRTAEWAEIHFVDMPGFSIGADLVLRGLQRAWFGVSVEDQPTADARIPELLRTPASVRFVSYEPALAPVDFRRFLGGKIPNDLPLDVQAEMWGRRGLGWVIVGGESGTGARPFDLEWARKTIDQCKAAGVACFFKQAGARPFSIADRITSRGAKTLPEGSPSGFYRCLNDRKGGDLSELPEWANVREFPEVRV